jgi:hypothetical protein
MNFETKKLIDIFYNHCLKNGILKSDAQESKKMAIIDNLIAAFVLSEMTLPLLEECISDVYKGNVFNLDFFNKGGRIIDIYISPKWQKFAKELFRQRSVGLGTPNAASGEGELMMLFLGKNIKKPKKGDIQINDKIYEIKSGEDIRVMSDIPGEDFRKESVLIAKKFNLVPNNANVKKGNIEAVELEKDKHFSHWNNQIKKLTKEERVNFINNWLKILDKSEHYDSARKIVNDSSYDQQILIKEIIKILFSYMVSKNNFNKFIMFDKNREGKIISTDVIKFNEMVDKKIIIPKADYFRINQRFNVGYYIK